MASFGRKGAPISESLLKTQPVRYKLGAPPPANGNSPVSRRMLAAGKSHLDGPPLPMTSGDRVALDEIRGKVLPFLTDRIDVEAASNLDTEDLIQQIRPILQEILAELKVMLNRREEAILEKAIIDELLGLGPLEPLLADPDISDIMVNGPNQIYIEKQGKLQLTDVKFRNEEHVMHVASRICIRVGRRVDQTTPLADARLADGSRVNIIIPPLSLKGPAISIRKFSKIPIDFDRMVALGTMSAQMVKFLKIASRTRLNVVVSGGTGAGKTTLLNALSKNISDGERIVTIEDAAELQLQQPHVLPLETRPANLEGDGAISIRDLVINALRMRPDRIILGEVRGGECLDMLQAMNTGHEGSMCTLHANSPREALIRLQNLASVSGLKFPIEAIRTQISEAIDMVVQIARMRDGTRRITHITEVAGMESDIIVTQDLFRFVYESEDSAGKIVGRFECSGLRPVCYEKVREFGLADILMDIMAGRPTAL